MLKPGLVQGGCGLETGDVAAQLGRFTVGPQHRRHRVPPHRGPDPAFHLQITRVRRFVLGGGGVQVRRVGRGPHPPPPPAGPPRPLVPQPAGPFPAPPPPPRVPPLPPFPGLPPTATF